MANITYDGKPMHTSGELPSVGSMAPDFTMTKEDLSEVRLADCLGKTTILNIFPSLDTPICAKAMQRFNMIAGGHPKILVLCVSADLPFAQKHFCKHEHLPNIMCTSIFRDPGFGDQYGLRIVDGPLAGLLSRVVIVLNENGEIIHTEQITELTDEPDYQAMLSSIKLKTSNA